MNECFDQGKADVSSLNLSPSFMFLQEIYVSFFSCFKITHTQHFPVNWPYLDVKPDTQLIRPAIMVNCEYVGSTS